MADRKFTITKGGDLTPSRNRQEMDREASKAKRELDDAVAKGKITAAQREQALQRIGTAARKTADEEVSGTERANRASDSRIRKRNEEARAAEQAYGRVKELQDKIEKIDRDLETNLKDASQERAAALRRRRDAYRELMAIQREYNADVTLEANGLKETQRLLDNTNAALRRRARATADVTVATNESTRATVQNTEATARATRASQEHTQAAREEKDAVEAVGRAHEETNRRRRGGGGGGGGNNPPPPGGGGDDPWDEYFQKRLEKALAELRNKYAAEARAAQRQVQDLNRRESFREGEDRLEGMRLVAQELYDSLRKSAAQIVDSGSLREVERALGRLDTQIEKTQRALREQSGDANGLRNALAALVDETDHLRESTERQTAADVQAYNQSRRRLELARNLAQAELGRGGQDERSRAQLQRVVDRANEALDRAKDTFSRDGTIDLDKTVAQFDSIADATREQTTNTRELNKLSAERRVAAEEEAKAIRVRLERDIQRLEVARKTAATMRDQKAIDDQIVITRNRIAALDRARELGGIYRDSTLQGFRFDAARSWRDTNDAIRETRRSSVEYRAEVDRTSGSIRRLMTLMQRNRAEFYKAGWVDSDFERQTAALLRFEIQLRKFARSGRDISGLRQEIAEFGNSLNRERRSLTRFEAALERLGGRFDLFRRLVARAEGSTRRFNLVTTVATVALEPFLALILGVASGLLSLASAAVGAGTALGGALVAGIAQALPILGLFAFAFKGLSDVIQLSNQQQQDQINNIGRAARGVGDSAGGVDKLASSTDNLTQSQKQLSDARQQAIRDLEDLADKEKEASLAARDSTLSVMEAEQALRDAQETGTALDVARARLSLDEARVRQRQSFRDRNRVYADARVTRAEGVEGNDQVVSARKQLADAERSLAQARTGGAGAAAGLTQATSVLEEKMRRLSPVQRELLKGITDLRQAFSKGPFGQIRDIILQPFVGAIRNITKLAGDSEIVKSFTGLARSISGVLDRVFQGLTGPRGKALLIFLNAEAGKNVKIIGDGLASLGGIFEKIIRAASPLLTFVLKGIAGTLDEIDNKLTTAGLKKFFESQKPTIENFGKIIRESFILLKNLFELSAPSGNSLLGTFANFLKGINTQLADPAKRRELRNFFDEIGKGFGELAGGLADVAKALFSNLNRDTLSNFAKLLSEVVAPALGNIISVSALVVSGISAILNIPYASKLLAFALAFTVLSRTFTAVVTVISPLRFALIGLINKIGDLAIAARGSGGMIGFGAALEKSTGKFGDIGKRFTGLRGSIMKVGGALASFGPWGIAFATAALLFADPIMGLMKRFGLLRTSADDAKNAIKQLNDAMAAQGDLKMQERLAVLDKKDAFIQRRDAGRELRAARKSGDQERIDEAKLSFERADAYYQMANGRLEDIRKQITDNTRKINDERKNFASGLEGMIKNSLDSTGMAEKYRGFTGGLDDQEKANKVIRDLTKNLEESPEWEKMGVATRGKIISILQTGISNGVEFDLPTLQMVVKMAMNGSDLDEIAAAVQKYHAKMPVDVYLVQQSYQQTKEQVEYLVKEIKTLRGYANDFGFVGAGAAIHERRGRMGESRFAAGGLVSGKRGGQRVLVGEAGYDEFIISTDPTRRSRSLELITQAARRLALPGVGGSGSSPEGSDHPDWGKGYGDPPSLRGKARRGSAKGSSEGPLQTFYRMFREARRLDGMDIPYSWGGGHGSSPVVPSRGINSDGNDGTNITGLDCSSSVSAVMQAGYSGFPTITSGMFPSQSIMESGPGLVTVWSNPGHVFMSFGAQDWGTGGGNPGGGPGFNSHSKGGFVATHPSNLGMTVKTPSPAFNQIYKSLIGAGLDKISSVGDQLHQMGRLAAKYGDNFTKGIKNPSKLVAGIAGGLNKTISDFLGPFRGFRTGGYTPSGSDSQAYLGVLHGGEGVIDAQSMRDVRSGKTGKDVVKEIVGAVFGAVADGIRAGRRGTRGERDTSELGKLIRGLFSADNNVIDVNGNKKGGKFRVTNKAAYGQLAVEKFEGVLNKMEALVLKQLTGIEKYIEKLRTKTAKKNQEIADKLEGTFNEVTGVFTVGPAAGGQGFESEAASARLQGALDQRVELNKERTQIQRALSAAGSSKRSIDNQRKKVRQALTSLRGKLSKTKNPKKRKQIEREIKNAEAALASLDREYEQAEATERSAQESLDANQTDLDSNAKDIGAAQSAKIDALLSDATSGDLSPQAADAKTREAEALARQMGDKARIRTAIRARAQAATSNADAQIALGTANARYAAVFGTGNMASAFQSITSGNQAKLTAAQNQYNELDAEKVDRNSDAMLALAAQIADLQVAVVDSTKAYYEARVQSAEASGALASSQARRSQYFLDDKGMKAAFEAVTAASRDKLSIYQSEKAALLAIPGMSENSDEIKKLTAQILDLEVAISESTRAYIDAKIAQSSTNADWAMAGARRFQYFRGGDDFIAQQQYGRVTQNMRDQLPLLLQQMSNSVGTEAYAKYATQYQNLFQQIAESVRAPFQAREQAADSRASLATSLARRMQYFNGATGKDGNALFTQYSNITRETTTKRDLLIAEKNALLAEGLTTNSEVIQQLTAQIADLDVTIADSTKAYYEARLQNVDARMGYLNALLRGEEIDGDIAGATSVRQRIGVLLQERVTTLQDEIAKLISQGVSENSTELINLRTALEEAYNAIKENTNAITGTTQQNFSSTAWQIFREAIFNGNNGLTSRYASIVPQMAVGGSILSDGLIYAHRGEQIIPASVSRTYSNGGDTNIEVIVNEAQQTADPAYIAKRLAFELAGR